MHWRRQWHPTLVLLPGKSTDGGAWKAAVHGVTQSGTLLKRLSSSNKVHKLHLKNYKNMLDIYEKKLLNFTENLKTKTIGKPH